MQPVDVKVCVNMMHSQRLLEVLVKVKVTDVPLEVKVSGVVEGVILVLYSFKHQQICYVSSI